MIERLTSLVLNLIGLAWVVGLGAFTLASLREHEHRAARMAFALAGAGCVIFLIGGLAPQPVKLAALGLLGLGGMGLALSFVLPNEREKKTWTSCEADTPQQRYDERDILFARVRLKPGSPEYRAYYTLRPEKQPIDDQIRARPGLLSHGARFANPLLFASPEGSFGLTEALREAVDGQVAAERQELSEDKMTAYIKGLARYYGALDVGVTELKPYHVYSHIGRGSGPYGEPLSVEHRYAIAFTVEMDYGMMGASPFPPVVMESARQYVEAARVAVQLAGAIRALGYPARAHIDGNYRVIAPLVGRDAGLGEIGRMGLLMTPRQGPRVRLGVVTTDVGLIIDGRKPDRATIDFCLTCKKCAENCPSKSIPFGEREMIDGALRWRIDADRCFGYWNMIGTDCGRCMAVCPFSHPDSLVHNLVRFGVAHSGLFRRSAVRMDDLFYGRKPARRAAPPWARVP
jgi:ferredoxin